MSPPHESAMIRALVFDFDGLILDTETPLIDAHGDVHGAHGLPFDRAAFAHLVGHVEFVFDEWSAFGPGADRAALYAEMRGHYRQRVERQPVRPGVVALFAAADAAGLQLAVVRVSAEADDLKFAVGGCRPARRTA